MFLLQASGIFDWQKILLGEDDWKFIPEVILRSIIMFSVVLTALSILGKRGVRQLSVFELVVIITLGSAAGDPMFYKDVGIIPAIGVFVVIVSLYLGVTWLVGKSSRIEKVIEGHPVYLVENGEFAIHNFEKEPLAQDEFFAELRVQGVSQLGQIETAIIETNGEISLFFYEDEDVQPGLPILPHAFEQKSEVINEPGTYACTFCGTTKHVEASHLVYPCERCKQKKWVKASSRRRVT